VKRSILVVEDERLSRIIIIATLESHGFHCIAAENGQQALELLTIRHCDLILTDLKMPVVDGVEFIKIVRNREKLKGEKAIPIVVLSAASGEMAIEAKQLGISDFFVKSISIDKLVPKIRFLLGEIVWKHHCNPH
jgi:CheY-like chemotaxis protein